MHNNLTRDDFTIVYRTPVLITDSKGRIVAVLAGTPQEREAWSKCMQGVQAAMDEAFSNLRWTDARTLPDNSKGAGRNRRGPYYTLAAGLSFGGGQKVRCFDARCACGYNGKADPRNSGSHATQRDGCGQTAC